MKETKSSVSVSFKMLKYLGICFGLFVVFSIGHRVSRAVSLWEEMVGPTVHTDSSVREKIGFSLGAAPLPSSATHLYYAQHGFQDPSLFVAFNISQDEFERMIEKYLKITIDSFKKQTSWPDSIVKRGPVSWEEKHFDMYWYLDEGTEMLVYEGKLAFGKTVIYVPSQKRVFICLWGGSVFVK